jgi:hypothetical protein
LIERLDSLYLPEITDGRCFAGCWNNLTFCLWGRDVELLVDAVTMAFTDKNLREPVSRRSAFGILARLP